ncbi:MAG TPA: hypothetical protein VLH85_00205 [Levilinea sp.]|nr:hypothetical protein [Levilinea sp.]
MKWSYWRFFVGGGLLLMGVFALLQALGVFPSGNLFVALVFGVLFAGLGLAFLSVLSTGRQNWWAVIPGVVLLSLATIILLGGFAPTLADSIGGAIFLGGISLAFWLVYYLTPHNWWAIIPAGVLLTLAGVTLIPDSGGIETGGVFFLGLSLTFLALALIPVEGKRMSWPLIPGGILFFMGMLLLLSRTNLVDYIWPVALILVGLFLVLRPYLRRGHM